jgi:DNA-binding CsgD family transcriptional regulator
MTTEALICGHCGSIRNREMTPDGLKNFPITQPLTEAERRTVAFICGGMTNREVAVEMQTSEQMVKNRLRTIYNKTGMGHRGELITRVWKFVYEGR